MGCADRRQHRRRTRRAACHRHHSSRRSAQHRDMSQFGTSLNGCRVGQGGWSTDGSSSMAAPRKKRAHATTTHLIPLPSTSETPISQVNLAQESRPGSIPVLHTDAPALVSQRTACHLPRCPPTPRLIPPHRDTAEGHTGSVRVTIPASASTHHTRVLIHINVLHINGMQDDDASVQPVEAGAECGEVTEPV